LDESVAACMHVSNVTHCAFSMTLSLVIKNTQNYISMNSGQSHQKHCIYQVPANSFCTFHDKLWALHDIVMCHDNREIWAL
jgi:hypothetical protein